MENKHSARFLRQRKMLVVLPLLAIPFITMAFWALGGGKGTTSGSQSKAVAGLNLQLPNANLKNDKNEDKLSFYKEADADSLKRAELLRNDPYFKDSVQKSQTLMNATANLYNNASVPKTGLNPSLYKTGSELNEEKIYQKINELNKQINQPEVLTTSYNNSGSQENETNGKFSKDVDKMGEMMQLFNEKQETDPEMQQLNGTLDKILDIQHPQRVADKIKEQSLQKKEAVFTVSKFPKEDNISLINSIKTVPVQNITFFSANDNTTIEVEDNAVEAFVFSNQTLVNGSVIKLCLATNIYVSGALLPKGNFIYGIVSLNDERLEIEIKSIRHENSLFPVKMEVYDLDGMAGIHIPGAITRDVAKQSADNGLQLMELTSVDPSLKAQAAAAGVSTVKNLLSKKVKQIKVVVKAGYKVLLKSKNLQ